MYHEPGAAGAQVRKLRRGVNITLGLHLHRTSSRFIGTALDLAGTGARPMNHAASPRQVKLAIELAQATASS